MIKNSTDILSHLGKWHDKKAKVNFTIFDVKERKKELSRRNEKYFSLFPKGSELPKIVLDLRVGL